eukprot:1951791-Prymnesium_polylepis.1
MIPVRKASRIVTATLAAIMFTNFAMAPFTGPLIRALKLGEDGPSARSSRRNSAISSRRGSLKALGSHTTAGLSEPDPASGSLPLVQPVSAAPTLPPHGTFSLDTLPTP